MDLSITYAGTAIWKTKVFAVSAGRWRWKLVTVDGREHDCSGVFPDRLSATNDLVSSLSVKPVRTKRQAVQLAPIAATG